MSGPSRFCVLTYGRTGSTSLMKALEGFPDIAVPNKNVCCIDNELVHPRRVADYVAQYTELCGRPIADGIQLIDEFFAYNVQATYVGFKTMPRRHTDYFAFIARRDIQFITLIREDIPSTIASLVMAEAIGCWGRAGEQQSTIWRFVPDKEGPRVRGILSNIRRSRNQLDQVPNAIRLIYEDLCSPEFRNEELDAYFGRPIKIENALTPTCARDYVVNWDEFVEFITT